MGNDEVLSFTVGYLFAWVLSTIVYISRLNRLSKEFNKYRIVSRNHRENDMWKMIDYKSKLAQHEHMIKNLKEKLSKVEKA